MKIWLSEAISASMLQLAGRFGPLETGGVLVGWRSGEDWIVNGLIGAGPRAMHCPQSFVPDHDYQLRQLQLAFAASAGDLDYLGDWHTHPTGPARMSRADRRTLRRIARTTLAPVMVIVDPSARRPEVGGWTCLTSKWFRRPIRKVVVRHFNPPGQWPTVNAVD